MFLNDFLGTRCEKETKEIKMQKKSEENKDRSRSIGTDVMGVAGKLKKIIFKMR
jgi:hypothetical protein